MTDVSDVEVKHLWRFKKQGHGVGCLQSPMATAVDPHNCCSGFYFVVITPHLFLKSQLNFHYEIHTCTYVRIDWIASRLILPVWSTMDQSDLELMMSAQI